VAALKFIAQPNGAAPHPFSSPYDAMAETISQQRSASINVNRSNAVNKAAWDAVYAKAIEMAKQYKRDNPKFQPHTFFRACGFGAERVAEAVAASGS
jgi:hypothetical protein